MITKLNPDVIQNGSITAEKLADGIANDIISSLSTQSTLPSLTDYYIGQNAGGHTDTYFKKTLQSIGSVFQHELYDKVYLKDGSDPTFGNITAWQLNLSENSSVWYADGFGLALGVNDCAFLVGEEDGVYYSDAAGNTQTMLHSGNIGNYKSGDSDKLGGYGLTSFLLMTGRDYTEMDLNTIGGSQSIFTEIRPTEVTTTNCPISVYGALLSLKDRSGIAKMQFLGSYDSSVLYFRSQQKVGADITSAWKTIAFTDSNVASATKLQTPRKLWGQSFDGTDDVNGTFRQLYPGSYDGAVAHSILCNINGPYGLITRINGNGDVLQQAQRETTEVEWFNFILQPLGGNVGIGNTSPTEKLDVTGNVKASGNIICSNLVTTGMINQIANNSYIVHNAVSNGDHKMWITDGVGKSISAGSAFASDALNIISDTLLVLVAQYDYDIRVLKGSRTAKVIDSVNYSTLLPYKTPVAISSTYSSNPHNIAMADNTLYIVNENESDDRGCTILSFPTNDGSTPLTCGLLYTTYADSTGEFSCPTVIWSYNITPLMEPDATFEMWFTSYDGGTTWYGTHTVYK